MTMTIQECLNTIKHDLTPATTQANFQQMAMRLQIAKQLEQTYFMVYGHEKLSDPEQFKKAFIDTIQGLMEHANRLEPQVDTENSRAEKSTHMTLQELLKNYIPAPGVHILESSSDSSMTTLPDSSLITQQLNALKIDAMKLGEEGAKRFYQMQEEILKIVLDTAKGNTQVKNELASQMAPLIKQTQKNIQESSK